MTYHLETAKQFAHALDTDDYTTAAALWSPVCEYACRGTTHIGRECIIETNRQNGVSAKRDFDQVTYESRCKPLDEHWTLIHFVDQLTKSRQSFTFACQQRVQMNDCGQIVRIEHQDLPKSLEDLTEFKRSVGLGKQ